MKKLFGILSVFIFSNFVPVFASPEIPVELDMSEDEVERLVMELDGQRKCNLFDSQQASLEYVIDMFEKHADSRIAKRLFGQENFQMLSSAYTDEFIQRVEETLAMCDGSSSRESNPYRSYEDFLDGLTSYIQMTMMLKQFAPQVEGYDPIVPAMRQLRDHLAGDMIAELIGADETRGMYLDQSGSVNMTFAMNGNEGMVSANLDLGLDVVSDPTNLADPTFSGAFDVGGGLSVRTSDENMQIGGSMGLDMRMVDGTLYVGLTDVMVDESSLQFETVQERTEYKEAMQMIKLFDGKFVEIPLMPDEDMLAQMYGGIDGMSPEMGGDMWMMQMQGMMIGDMQTQLVEQQQMIANILTQDRMTTYAKAGNTYYVGFNPVACESVADMGPDMVTECLGMWMDMVDHTDGKGMMEITMDGAVTTLGVTDQFMDPEFKAPAEMADMVNRPLMAWTADEIVMLDIPFGLEENGKLSYKDGNLSIKGNIPNETYDRETGEMQTEMILVDVSGTIRNGMRDISGTVTGMDEISVAMDMEMTIDRLMNGSSSAGSLLIQVQNDEADADFEKILMQFDREDVSEYIEPVEISAPDESDIIDMEVLMGM